MVKGDVDVAITTIRAFNGNVFDGVDDYVDIPHSDLQLGAKLTGGFTISAWINPKTFGETSAAIIDKSSSSTGTNGFIFGVNSTPKLFFRINNGTVAQNDNYSYFLWQHVLVTISSAQLTNFYINGVISGSADQDLVQGISAITTTNAMRIGNRSTSDDRTFDGAIRSVKMWNRVLTAAEIAKDYAGDLVSSGLIHCIKLGGDYTDCGSVGVTATNSGSLPVVMEDSLSNVIKTQYALIGMGISGSRLMMCKGAGGQMITAALQNI